MLKSSWVKLLQLKINFLAVPGPSRSMGACALLALALFAFLPRAAAQDFTLSASEFNPTSVEPGPDGSTLSTVTVSTVNSVSGVNVDLSCAVTSSQTGVVPPTCTVSPTTVTTPGQASLTVSAAAGTTPGNYTVTVTGVSSTTTLHAPLTLAVLSVAPQYTILVSTTIAPTSVTAGNGATAIITLNPIDGYSGNVTLTCSQVSPPVVLAPTCTFSPPTVALTGNVQETATLTLSTTGPNTPTANAAKSSRLMYAFLFPGLTLLAGIAAGKRRRKLLATTGLLTIAALVLLTPGCGNSNGTVSNTGVTPNNTYTFTVTGFDGKGQAPGNATALTVSLTVN
jgi:hypothetical protein